MPRINIKRTEKVPERHKILIRQSFAAIALLALAACSGGGNSATPNTNTNTLTTMGVSRQNNHTYHLTVTPNPIVAADGQVVTLVPTLYDATAQQYVTADGYVTAGNVTPADGEYFGIPLTFAVRVPKSYPQHGTALFVNIGAVINHATVDVINVPINLPQ